jgi:hypothetical protein
MNMENQSVARAKDEVTIIDFIIKIKINLLKLNKNKWYIIISAIAFSTLFFLYSYFDKTKYKAELTFMVYQDEGSKLGGGLSSMLGAIGLPSSDKVNLEKIIELSKTNQILFETLFDSTIVDGRNDYLVNHFIILYELDKNFDNKIRFTTSDFNKLSLEQKQLLNIAKDLLVGKKGILESSFGVKTGIMNFSLTTLNENLSIDFLTKHFKNLSAYYIDKSIAKETRTYQILKNKVDGLYGSMNYNERSAASYENKNLGVWQEIDKVQPKINRRDATINTIVYGEALKNLELADFTLRNKTPFIQEIDTPFTPLEKIKKSVKLFTILGALIGAILASFIILIINYFKGLKFE